MEWFVALVVFAGVVLFLRASAREGRGSAAPPTPNGPVERALPPLDLTGLLRPEEAPRVPPAPRPRPRAPRAPTPPPRQPCTADTPARRRMLANAEDCVARFRTGDIRTLSGRATIIDGDTIIIEDTKIRLFGIDAPELDQPFGLKSKWALVALCKGKTVTAHVNGALSHDRVVAVCTLPCGADLGAQMVRQGLALDWPQFSGGTYRHLEPEGVRKRMFRTARRCI